MNKVNFQEVTFTQADAAEALETIAQLEQNGFGATAVRLMRDDPHEPPV